MACTGSQYGNFEQTLFLGCSIVSFAANAGWGEQSTELTIELVEDDCPTPAGESKAYWDTQLVKQAWTAADPGFVGETLDIIGVPAYFRIKDYEFTGIIQSWEKTNNTGGRRYIVKMVSPVSILENTKLIIGQYAGTTTPSNILPIGWKPHNIINVFGYAEKQGLACPLTSQSYPGTYITGDSGDDGATFGTPAGGFGGSLLNNNGMPWYMIKNVFNILVNASPILTGDVLFFSPNGRVTGKGLNVTGASSPWNNGFGLITSDGTVNSASVTKYFVDLSELPSVPDYFRFNQTEVSLLECISRICKESGHDFYIELLPVPEGVGLSKFIKIRTVSRIQPPPSFGAIQTFADAAEAEGTLRGSSIGREFRNEINSRFVIGGLKQTLYQAWQSYDPEGDGQPSPPEADDMILPYFGTDSSGNMIVPYINNSGEWEFSVETDDIETSLTYATFSGSPITINESELRASLGSERMWITEIINRSTDTLAALNSMKTLLNFVSLDELYHYQVGYSLTGFQATNYYVQNSGYFEGVVRDFHKLNDEALDLTVKTRRDVQSDTTKIYQWVSSFASNYYGLKFAVRVPFSCVTGDPLNGQEVLSEYPVQDGGWTEQSLGVLGLGLNSNALTFFRDDSNKIGTIVAYTGFSDLEVSELDPQSYVVDSNNLYLKGTVSSDYVYHNKATYSIPRAIVEIDQPITTGSISDAAIIHGLVKLADHIPGNVHKGYMEKALKGVGNKTVADAFADRAFIPDAVAFGMRSTINTYGPWVSLGKVGGIEVEKDDGLVPWEYGGYTNLDLAGNALALSNVTNMQVGEMGNVSIVGYPTIPLGAELNALTTLGGQQLVENRTGVLNTYNGNHYGGVPFAQDYFVYSYGFNQSGINGPTVTSINVNVGSEVTTQYQFRTYTPKTGRFARLNAERLKEVNQNRMRYVRDLRAYVRQNTGDRLNNSLSTKSAFRGYIKNRKQLLAETAAQLRPGTPHELFVGQLINWGLNGSKRTIISTSSINELSTELTSGQFEFKSISSFDSIIRPISLKGAGGLPRLIQPQNTQTGTGILPITQADLNPYINPTTLNVHEQPTNILNRRYDDSFSKSIGHDIDMISRANVTGSQPGDDIYYTNVPSGGLGMQIESGALDYHDDYRTFALRGPLLLHGWGYDTDDNPIPNYVDDPDRASSGIYETTGLTGSFMSGWSTKPHTWPVAPVDLRLDRDRGLWVAAGSTRGAGLTDFAVCTEEITAMSFTTGISGTNLSITPGEGSGILLDVSTIPFTTGENILIYNLSMTPIRASVEAPIVITCAAVISSGELEVTSYVASNIMDFRALPNFSTGEASGGDEDPAMQIPYHPGGSDEFTLDSVECSGTGEPPSG